MSMHPTLPSDFDLRPPTFNTLDSQQKTRLIRTTRKLGAVLGTTPHLAESGSPAFPPSRPPLNTDKPLPRPKNDRRRRQGSVFEIASPSKPYSFDYASSSSSASTSSASLGLPRASTDSSNSDASTQSLPTPRSFARHVREKSRGGGGSSSGKRVPLPTPLVLRLNAVALPLSDPRLTPPDSAATLKSAGSCSGSRSGSGSGSGNGNRTPMAPVTPTTPGTPTPPTATETRRKRLAKLKRTLGENVPAELVIPTPRAASSRRPSPLEGPSTAQAQAQALAPFPLMSAPQNQADGSGPSHTQQYHARPPPRAQKTYPLVYASPSSSPGRVSPRKRSVSVDFRSGFMSPPHATSAPVTPHPHPPPKPQLQPHPQAQAQAQQIRRAPSLSSRRRPAWPPQEPVGMGSPLSGFGEGEGEESGHGHGHGHGRGQGWVTGGSSWMGEWNRKDIHEVQRQLRNLKLR